MLLDKGHLADLSEAEELFLKKLLVVHEADISYLFSWQIIPMNHDVSGSKDTSLVIDETLKFRKGELHRKKTAATCASLPRISPYTCSTFRM